MTRSPPPSARRVGVASVEALEVADPIGRAIAAAALGLHAPLARRSAPTLEAVAARDPDARVRAAALGALVRAAGRKRAARAWRRALADTETVVRRRAAELTPDLGSLAAVRRVVPLLDDPDVTVVETAAWALGELGARTRRTGAVAALARTGTAHDDPLAREAAVAALGAIGDAAGLPAILAACTDRPAVRRRAVLALAPFHGDTVDAALALALHDPDWQVRQAAEDLTRR